MLEVGVSHISFSLWECTVNLEDIALHLGLPINGLVVTRITDLNVPLLQDMCDAWLSGQPEVKDFVGYAIMMS